MPNSVSDAPKASSSQKRVLDDTGTAQPTPKRPRTETESAVSEKGDGGKGKKTMASCDIRFYKMPALSHADWNSVIAYAQSLGLENTGLPIKQPKDTAALVVSLNGVSPVAELCHLPPDNLKNLLRINEEAKISLGVGQIRLEEQKEVVKVLLLQNLLPVIVALFRGVITLVPEARVDTDFLSGYADVKIFVIGAFEILIIELKRRHGGITGLLQALISILSSWKGNHDKGVEMPIYSIVTDANYFLFLCLEPGPKGPAFRIIAQYDLTLSDKVGLIEAMNLIFTIFFWSLRNIIRKIAATSRLRSKEELHSTAVYLGTSCRERTSPNTSTQMSSRESTEFWENAVEELASINRDLQKDPTLEPTAARDAVSDLEACLKTLAVKKLLPGWQTFKCRQQIDAEIDDSLQFYEIAEHCRCKLALARASSESQALFREDANLGDEDIKTWGSTLRLDQNLVDWLVSRSITTTKNLRTAATLARIPNELGIILDLRVAVSRWCTEHLQPLEHPFLRSQNILEKDLVPELPASMRSKLAGMSVYKLTPSHLQQLSWVHLSDGGWDAEECMVLEKIVKLLLIDERDK
ncbi:hypothetical protein VNI00_012741 [Paramarasmius palmivorus]|uniref:Uncharacterized protein n=1 Tax=Paramarasmius palmivorus TaxID=297713 RepID=A0AAW0C623_9AGAR